MELKYNQIALDIKWKIKSGVYKPLEKLPSENTLANHYSCSRLTARRALQKLKDQKYVVSKKGKGYFVSLNRDKLVFTPKNGDKKLIYSVQRASLSVNKIIEKEFISLFKKTMTFKDDFNFSFYKKYIDEDRTFTVLRSFLNTKLLGKIEISDIKESLSAYFAKKNIRIIKRVERFVVETISKVVSIKMDLPKSSKIVVSYSIMFTKDNLPVEFAIRYIRLEDFKVDRTKKY